jgi:hypothetical protein
MTSSPLPAGYVFPGFTHPTTTPVPDELFDELAPRLTEAELRVLLYIVRRTFGFKRQSDRISLGQMAEGITTSDGRILDHGTGMSRRGVVKGCAGLVAKGIIVVEKQRAAQGDNDVNVYRLRFRAESGVGNEGTKGREQRALPVGNESNPQQTGEQETEKHHHGGEQMSRELIGFGLTANVARQLSEIHPAAYIRTKLDHVQWLMQTKSAAVVKNPAGYLRRAIEQDFPSPPGYQSPQQREVAKAARERRRAETLAAFAATAARDRASRPDLVQLAMRACPPQLIPGTAMDTQAAWRDVLEILAHEVSLATYSALLAHTALASCNDAKALVAGPSSMIIGLLRQRLSGLISDSLASSLGFRVAIDFCTFADLDPQQQEVHSGSISSVQPRAA